MSLKSPLSTVPGYVAASFNPVNEVMMVVKVWCNIKTFIIFRRPVCQVCVLSVFFVGQ